MPRGIFSSRAPRRRTNTWSVPSLENLDRWLRADLGVTTSGGSVTDWADQSGNGNDYSSTDSATEATGINSQATILFHAATPDILGGPTCSASEFSAYIVLKADDTNRSIWNFSTDTSDSLYPWSGDGHIYEGFGSSSRKATGYTFSTPTDPHVYAIHAGTDGSYSVEIDGTEIYTTTGNTVAFPNPTQFGIGGSGNPFGGDIAEFILVARKLSSGEKGNVMSYLRDRYATP